MAQRAETTWPPSLPQKDSGAERIEREAQLALTREIYAYSTASVLPMPMMVRNAAVLEAVERFDWVEGWLANQAKILADLELWNVETHGQAGFSTLADYAKVFTIFPSPDIIGTWQDDKIFAPNASRV